eukprot:TRINITY_DN1774_c0_g1_i6.p1 TRINITY_DN1774_c0_g1~~TRINITY_DN1774_c0_g1_i6.p1  ORF type:complete len:166 (-),score=37.02 TRINITY_DN1774_c0_g1_i6:148-645(-)
MRSPWRSPPFLLHLEAVVSTQSTGGHKLSSMVRYAPQNVSKRNRTKRRKKDTDEVYEDLTRPQSVQVIRNRKPDFDLPSLGNFYCIACARYFASQEILDQHCKSKAHKKRCKTLTKEVPYGVNLEEVYGKVDNGREVDPPECKPIPKGSNVTSVKEMVVTSMENA